MELYIWKCVFKITDEMSDAEPEVITQEIVAPNMDMETATKYMWYHALHQWPQNYITINLQHIQKVSIFGVI